MGVFTNAILFYGYCWDEEVDLFEAHRLDEDDEAEWPELLLRKRGEQNPWMAFPDEKIEVLPYAQRQAATDRWVAEHRAELDEWDAKRNGVDMEFDVELGDHCSGECSMPYLAAWELVAYRGCPQDASLPVPAAEWDEQLNRFLAEFGITPPQAQPGWWLVSYWN